MTFECFMLSRDRFMKRQKKREDNHMNILNKLKERGSPTPDIFLQKKNEYLRHLSGKTDIIQ